MEVNVGFPGINPTYGDRRSRWSRSIAILVNVEARSLYLVLILDGSRC
ncbi:MAG: hypothetical protein M3O33_14970 [Cyanobacteriota bacterium]|nr:hypothetical protein [Cyanobacteriota bacterium]